MVLRGEASEADLPTVAAVRDGSTPANWNPRQRGGVVAWREACAVGRGSRRARRTAAHLAALCLKLKAFRLAGRPHRAMAPWSFLTISRRDAALPWDGPTLGSAPLQGDSPRSGVPYRGSAPQRPPGVPVARSLRGRKRWDSEAGRSPSCTRSSSRRACSSWRWNGC